MSGYENAPATRLLATHCVACGRQLVDAQSVETGMGPDCRKRHGFEQEADDTARADMNRRVHALALWRSADRQLSLGKEVPTLDEAAEHLRAIRAAGFERLANVLESRLCDVTIRTVNAESLALFAPYNERLVLSLRRLPARFDPASKAWLFPVTKRTEMHAVLRSFFPSTLGLGPKGLFTLKAL